MMADVGDSPLGAQDSDPKKKSKLGKMKEKVGKYAKKVGKSQKFGTLLSSETDQSPSKDVVSSKKQKKRPTGAGNSEISTETTHGSLGYQKKSKKRDRSSDSLIAQHQDKNEQVPGSSHDLVRSPNPKKSRFRSRKAKSNPHSPQDQSVPSESQSKPTESHPDTQDSPVDSRFANIRFDPKFRKIKTSERKVCVFYSYVPCH